MCVPKGFGNMHGWALCLVTNAFTSLEIMLETYITYRKYDEM